MKITKGGIILEQLLVGIEALTIKQIAMFIIGGTLIFLAIKKGYEPMLLLPIGFGAILANIPVVPGIAGIASNEGVLGILKNAGITTELFPALMFVAVGAMVDFTPLLQMPSMLFFGAAAQFGIFMTILFALMLGFNIKEAASIGIIGAADGPTSIFVASKFAKHLLGPISVAAYSYMSLVPIIQPAIIKLLTTKEERKIRMEYKEVKVSKTVKILFPICVTIVAGNFNRTFDVWKFDKRMRSGGKAFPNCSKRISKFSYYFIRNHNRFYHDCRRFHKC